MWAFRQVFIPILCSFYLISFAAHTNLLSSRMPARIATGAAFICIGMLFLLQTAPFLKRHLVSTFSLLDPQCCNVCQPPQCIPKNPHIIGPQLKLAYTRLTSPLTATTTMPQPPQNTMPGAHHFAHRYITAPIARPPMPTLPFGTNREQGSGPIYQRHLVWTF